MREWLRRAFADRRKATTNGSGSSAPVVERRRRLTVGQAAKKADEAIDRFAEAVAVARDKCARSR